MKKIIFLLVTLIFLAGCSLLPYVQQSDLPQGISFYPSNKQFTVHPDWYWQLRLSKENKRDPVGFLYLKERDADYNHQNVSVVGEVNYQQNKFLVAYWQPHGYFFISEKDYQYAEKYKKYFLPLNYTSYMFINNGPAYAITAYYKDNSDEYILGLPAYSFADQPRSGLNLKIVLKLYFISSLISNKYIGKNTKYTDLIYRVIQMDGPAGYTNEFVEITPCPLFNEFSRDASVFSVESLAVERVGTKMYTNEYGQMYMGVIYKTKFIIARWGKAFYAFPCADK